MSFSGRSVPGGMCAVPFLTFETYSGHSNPAVRKKQENFEFKMKLMNP
jgi:hypothetical protein